MWHWANSSSAQPAIRQLEIVRGRAAHAPVLERSNLERASHNRIQRRWILVIAHASDGSHRDHRMVRSLEQVGELCLDGARVQGTRDDSMPLESGTDSRLWSDNVKTRCARPFWASSLRPAVRCGPSSDNGVKKPRESIHAARRQTIEIDAGATHRCQRRSHTRTRVPLTPIRDHRTRVRTLAEVGIIGAA